MNLMSKTAFDAYMRRVDRTLDEWVSLSHEDLPDLDYYARFLDEVSAEDAAYEALIEAGWSDDLIEEYA